MAPFQTIYRRECARIVIAGFAPKIATMRLISGICGGFALEREMGFEPTTFTLAR
jgi:hypothetical protein